MGFLKLICCGGRDLEADEGQKGGQSSGSQRPERYKVEWVTLLSKPWKGDAYTLNDRRRDQFRTQLRIAIERVQGALEALDKIERRGVNAASLLRKGGSDTDPYTPLGWLAHMFNLVKDADSISATDMDVQNLVRNVRAVLALTGDGLASKFVVGGIPEKSSREDEGYVDYKKNDTPFPEKLVELQSGVKKPPPALEDDDIFTNPHLRMRGKIHLDYRLLDGRTAWTVLLHEASHKFARTRDVNGPNSYKDEDRKIMHWTHAIRNAEHYAYLCRTLQMLEA